MNWKPNSLNFNTTIMPTIIKEHATITYSDLTPILRAVSSHSFNISTIKIKPTKTTIQCRDAVFYREMR